MALIWGHVKNASQPWGSGLLTGGRSSLRCFSLTPASCFLRSHCSVALVTGSARRNSNSAKPPGSLPSQPTSGQKCKGQTKWALGSLAPSPSGIPWASCLHLLTAVNYTTLFCSLSSMTEYRYPASPPPPGSAHTSATLWATQNSKKNSSLLVSAAPLG